MAKQVQIRRGSTTEHATFTGATGELTVDTDKDVVVVHDGTTAGGHPMLKQDLSNLPAGTIDNVDISASAAIEDTKLATISTANKVAASAIDIDGATDIGAALTDADLILVDDGGAGTNRKATATRISDYTFGKVSGDVTIASNGTAAISSGVIVDADISNTAEIAVSKLADGSARQLLQTDAAGTGVEWASNIDVPGTLDVTGAATFDSTVTISGDLTVNGTTTNINTTNLVVEDKNIIIGDTSSPSDVTADGGGITLKGATDKTLNWVDSTDAWTSSEHLNLANGKSYKINGTDVLTATALGSAVQISSDNIPNGTITNDDLAGSIADSKLNTISTADKVSTSALDIDGATDIGSALADADLFVVDDGGAGTNRKAAATRITDYAFGKVSGDITINNTGTAAIGSGVIVNADINASAAIAGTKVSPDFGNQNITTSGNLLMTGTGYIDIPVGTTGERPGSANSGMLRFNSDLGQFEGYNGTGWGAIGGGGGFEISTTPPVSPIVGDTYWDSDEGTAYIYYDDGVTSQWVPLVPSTSGGGAGFEVATTPPASPSAGNTYWDSDEGNAYIYYDDGVDSQWVPLVPSTPPKNATGGGTDEVFFENMQTVNTSYTLTTGRNAMSAGPITVSSGVSVTIPSGQSWVIV